jgi:hypothetical protein
MTTQTRKARSTRRATQEAKPVRQRVAIVTYNRIGEGQYENGVMQRGGVDIYIAQNGHRTRWAADGSNDKEATRRRVAGYVTKAFDLTDMSHVYLYVGSHGGEEAIRQTADIPATRITYVMCDCNLSTKQELIRSCGNAAAEVQMCECGGRDTLERILRQLLG